MSDSQQQSPSTAVVSVQPQQLVQVKKRYFLVSFTSIQNYSPIVCIESDDLKPVAACMITQCIPQERSCILFDRIAKRVELENKQEGQEFIVEKLREFGLAIIAQE